MKFQDLLDEGAIIAKEIGEIIKNALHTLYDTDIEVIGIYALILALGSLLIFGIRLLSDEIEDYSGRRANESGKLPWYLHGWVLLLAIAVFVLIVYAAIFVLVLA